MNKQSSKHGINCKLGVDENQIKILFVCHGNICRSPMAEFVFRDMVEKKGLAESFLIASSATSTEEIGNPVHPGTRKKLRQYGIDTSGKYAIQLRYSDYESYDYLIVMDEYNMINISRIIPADPEHKIHKLLDFTQRGGDIADPWYTGNFDVTYDDVYEGCTCLLQYILCHDAALL